MRIIKEGKIEEVWYEGTCTRCQTEIEATENEVRFESDEGTQRGAWVVTCPLCRTVTVWMKRKA